MQASPLVPANAAAYIHHAINWFTDALPNALAMGYQYPGQEYVRPGRQDAIVSADVIDNACRFCKMQGHYEAACWQKHPHLKKQSSSKTQDTVAKPRGPTRGDPRIKHTDSRETGRNKMTVPPAKGTGGRGALTRSGDRKGDNVVKLVRLYGCTT